MKANKEEKRKVKSKEEVDEQIERKMKEVVSIFRINVFLIPKPVEDFQLSENLHPYLLKGLSV